MKRQITAALCITGLAIISSGRVWGEDAPPDTVVLTVNGEAVMMSEYVDRLQRMRATDFLVSTNPLTVRNENSGLLMMNALIVERLTLQWAVKTGQMPKEDEITADFERLKQQPNVTQALQSGLLTEKITRYDLRLQKARYNIATTGLSVTAKEIEDWYKAHIPALTTPDKWGFGTIITSKQAVAAKIPTELKAGKTFEALAKQYSEEPLTKGNGGDLGTLLSNDGRIPEAVKAVARTIKIGEVSAPIKTTMQAQPGKPIQSAWWIIRIKSREAGATRPFGEIKDSVEKQAVLEKAGGLQAAEKKIADFRKTSAIKVTLPLYQSLNNAGS